jgi:hypothetical protein
MTSLQQTAMGGGSTTAKTANYVLVAADAGTTVAMDAATATTITVDTGLFAAGDTVFIQNIGAGDCTITAGTATVDTAGSLILPQYDAGILYFTSASAAIFYDYIQVGAASPLTTKGDLYTYGTSDTRLGVGANGTTLVANSSTSTGLEWATPAAGGGMTLISTTTLTGATVTLSSIPATYNNLCLVVRDMLTGTDNVSVALELNGDNGVNRYRSTDFNDAQGVQTFNASSITLTANIDNAVAQNLYIIQFYDYANTVTWKYGTSQCLGVDATTNTSLYFLARNIFYNQTNAISSIKLSPGGAGGFTSGTALLYGVK